MKKQVVVFMAAVMMFCFAITGAALADDAGDITIGISMQNQMNEFTKGLANAMDEACKAQGWNTVVTEANSDVSKQISQVETLLVDGVDGILIVPVDTEAMAPTVEKISESGIPCVVVNMVVNTDKFDAYVGSNDVNVGEDTVNWVADKLGGKGKICVMEGMYGYPAQEQRTEGIKKALENYPDIELLAIQTANWSREEAMALMENWFQEYGDEIDAVIAENDEMGLGAMSAIVAQAYDKEILVVGIDGLTDALTGIKEGTYSCTFLQDGKGQGEGGVEIMAKILAGEEYEKEVWLPFQQVTAENIDEYVD